MVENHVSPTSRWEEEGQMVENHVISTSGLQVGRTKWLKIMLFQHLDGTRKEKMVENHVSSTSGWHEEG